jgi:hypothetical protein
VTAALNKLSEQVLARAAEVSEDLQMGRTPTPIEAACQKLDAHDLMSTTDNAMLNAMLKLDLEAEYASEAFLEKFCSSRADLLNF